MKENEIEFLTEITSQIVEEKFGEFAFIFNEIDDSIKYSEEAQDFFNERYDEIETLYIKLIKNETN